MPEIHLPALHEGQIAIYRKGMKVRYNVVRCGRRWGKTFMLSTMASSCALHSFPLPGLARMSGGRVGIFTAEYRQYQEIFDKLVELLEPLIKTKSRSEKRILLKNGGKIDFWVTNDNKLAGRGREYNLVLCDEAAFTKVREMLQEVWPKSIKPTLLTTGGSAWVFSTPDGIDDDNFFYALCNDKKMGFLEHYAPTSSNPYVPPEELEKERLSCDPRVFRQEFLAEFVDWSENALLDLEKLLVDGLPIEPPTHCDTVFAVMDTALKGGTEHDGTGIIYFAYEETYHEPRLTILDWDVWQIDAALVEVSMPGVFARLEDLSRQCGARHGSQGLYIEDAQMGAILLQKAQTQGWQTHPISSILTAKGKDERAVLGSSPHYLGKCKITRYAYDKVVQFKQKSANHLIKQVGAFHLADKAAHKRADDLLDCYLYGLLLAFGDERVL